jgi:hypothetical protein
MNIIQFSLKKTGLRVEDWISGRPIDIDKLKRQLETTTDRELQPLWKKGGTCASFAVGVRSIIGENGGRWTFGDTGFHKSSYSSNGIVIDYSAKKAFSTKGGERSQKLLRGELGRSLTPSCIICVCFPPFPHRSYHHMNSIIIHGKLVGRRDFLSFFPRGFTARGHQKHHHQHLKPQ